MEYGNAYIDDKWGKWLLIVLPTSGETAEGPERILFLDFLLFADDSLVLLSCFAVSKSWSREILIQKAPLPFVHSHSVSYGWFKRRLVDFLSIEYWTL